MDITLETRIADKLKFLYGDTHALDRLKGLIETYRLPPRSDGLSERDALLIAYGDHVRQPGQPPLVTLGTFARSHLRDLISGIHILPFYPYTSDDGFSVVDYRAVDPALGGWDDVRALGADFQLMFDLVLNHASVASAWFQGFLRDEEPYRNYFVTASPDDDLSQVVRPRTLPLLTPFQTAGGQRYVWTTFSADQVDLNYANPDVLLEIIETLLFYVHQGAAFIRLDAIAYLWKTPGTSCIHLPQTHTVVQLMRDVLDATAPWVKLITETNVPHEENLSYFGDGTNEAQMVYQFALPPLLLHALHTGDARTLASWADGLRVPSDRVTFFNFTASHDGIGVRPASGLVPEADLQRVYDAVIARGGHISYKSNSDGSQSAYELNITYFDALAVPGEPLERSVDRFLASQAVMLALVGVPGIYLPSLFGAGNWEAGVAQTGRARTINREKYDLGVLEAAIRNPAARSGQVFQRYQQLLRVRRTQPAFDPANPQRVLDMHPAVFALQRSPLLALHNLSGEVAAVDLPGDTWHDLVSGGVYSRRADLRPYQILWLLPGASR